MKELDRVSMLQPRVRVHGAIVWVRLCLATVPDGFPVPVLPLQVSL